MATNYWCVSMFGVFLFLLHLNLEAATKQTEDVFQFENNSLDISILKSKNEKFLIYRNTGKKECYIERMTVKNSEDEQNSRTLYVGPEPLKKSDKVYSELDDDTKNFCNQFSVFVLQEEPPKYIAKNKHVRRRREARMPKQRYKTQTQTQHITIDGGRGNNTAASPQLSVDPVNSRLIVSGNIRLEQSQSQFDSTDCSECNNWPRGPQTYEIPKYPLSPEVNRPQTEQSYVPSNQQQTGSQPQNFVPGYPPRGESPSGVPGQQIVPASGTGYFPGSSPTVQSQPPGYFTPGSQTQQNVPQIPQYLPPNQYIPQPSSTNTPTNFQVPVAGFQPAQQSGTSPSVNPQTGPLIPSNSQPTVQGYGGSTYPSRPQYVIPGSQQQNSGTSSPGFQSSPNFPGNTQPTGYYNNGNVNDSSRTPAYFYLILQPSQQNPQAPQYFLFNSQTIYPQNSNNLMTNPGSPSYFSLTAQPTQQAQPFPQIFSVGQVVPLQGSQTGYVPSSNQNTFQPGHSGGTSNPQSQPSTQPSTQTVPQQSSGGTGNIPGGSKQEPNIQTGSTNFQPTANIPQTNTVVLQQSTGGVIQPQVSTNIPSSSQIQPNPAGGLIYCQSCTYVPVTPQQTVGTPTNLYSYPTFQQGSGIVSTGQQNFGGPQSQIRPYQFPAVSSPVSAVYNQQSTLSQTGLVADPNHPFQAQYIPQISVPYQQPQIIPPGTQVNQPGTSGYAPVPGANATPNQPQEIISGPQEKPIINSPTIYQQPQAIPPGTQVNQPGTSDYAPVPGANATPNQPQEIISGPQEKPIINSPTIYQQPQAIPPGTQVNQPETSGYVPLPGSNINPYHPQEITSGPQNYPNERSTVIPNISQNGGSVKICQNGSSIIAVEDDIVEEALSVSSINIINNATRAEAISQGKTKKGIVKAEVSGTYTKDFSAKAQTIDPERSAISQIFGNGTGAISTSYGRAGKSESQSQVLYSHETGSAVAESQGSGVNYNFAGQIQSGIRGGQSNSMAAGPGNTFSQAQIGFVPTFEENFSQQSIFQGGGTASSNISRHSGLTDIKFQGQFRSGPQFTGRVQAGAGKVSQNQTKIAFNSTNLTDLSRKDITTPKLDKAAEIAIEEERTEGGNNNAAPLKLILPQPLTNNSLDTLSEFGVQTSNPQKRLLRAQASNQRSIQNGDNKVDPLSSKFLHAGEIIPGTKSYKVPSGFRGRFLPQDVHPSDIRTSVTNSGRTTEIDYRGPAKQGKIYIQKYNFQNLNDGSDGFMTVTKSETGEFQDKIRNYDHTYYTKSSTCGFFTYTCNLIDGPDGRTKICKQNPPTDINGIPC